MREDTKLAKFGDTLERFGDHLVEQGWSMTDVLVGSLTCSYDGDVSLNFGFVRCSLTPHLEFNAMCDDTCSANSFTIEAGKLRQLRSPHL